MKKLILVAVSLISFSAMANDLERKCLVKLSGALNEITLKAGKEIELNYADNFQEGARIYMQVIHESKDLKKLKSATKTFCKSLSVI